MGGLPSGITQYGSGMLCVFVAFNGWPIKLYAMQSVHDSRR